MCLHDSFLGSYGSANKKNPDEWHFLDWRECQVCETAGNCDLDCHVINKIPFHLLGGFVLEPGSASGLVRFPPKQFIQNLIRMTKSNGGRIQINEITTGIGRSGKWFGFQHYDIQPDLISMGKGLGNGYPISAIALSAEVAGMLVEKSFYYQQSHQNDPLGCRVVKEVIEVIRKDRLVDKCKEKGEYLLSQLKILFADYEYIKEIRGRGLMIALEFQGPGFWPAAHIFTELFNRGFIVSLRPGLNALRIDPPLIVERAEFTPFLNALKEILNLAERAGKNG